jgi:hypothetical protein
MHSVSTAEWIVARFAGKKQAASIVGDLLEVKPQKGTYWFWFSLAGVVLSLAWRRPVAFVAAICTFFAACGGSFLLQSLHLRFMVPDYPWRNVWGVLFLVSNGLWLTLVYAAIRFGVRDRVTQISLALAPLTTAGLYFWSRPAILLASITLIACVVAASILRSERRRAALVLLVVLMAGCGVFLLTDGVATLYRHFMYPGLAGDSEMQRHPGLLWIEFCMLFLMTPWMMTSACSRMHRWLLRNPSLD